MSLFRWIKDSKLTLKSLLLEPWVLNLISFWIILGKKVKIWRKGKGEIERFRIINSKVAHQSLKVMYLLRIKGKSYTPIKEGSYTP